MFRNKPIALAPFCVLGFAVSMGSSPPASPQAATEDPPPTWNVSSPPGGEDIEIQIDTDEGTWMNLDVSPDGQQIVFDLLGDLYLLSIDGGEAKELSAGIAWDMQPRFSPDGQSVAFTSDRGGGDNIWVTPIGGGEARAISNETFRLLNNPTWSPDGEYIAARKHFSSQRSLGSGEIWLYHVSGRGEGLQLNDKPNDQKDLGEPAFSSDGRYVYFSQDMTPGAVFEYNKDSNSQLYVVRRIDRQTGEVATIIRGPGGAARPTPSPDGRSLAFVRRERFQSKLFVHDLESGENRIVVDELDRDMQEIWAIHGVYANFAWTPDSASIVFWAGGKIQRVDVDSRTKRPIDFHVSQTLRAKKALKFSRNPAPERYKTHMIRWVETSPDASTALFQALGHIYIRELPDGEPRRLTTQTDHFELYPSFSRDGQSVVYVSWDDGELGRVRIAPASGVHAGRIITDKPGHYLEPRISPRGEWVVYRKASGDRMRSFLWSSEPGIYSISIGGGTPKKIRSSGRNPHFGADDERIYFVESEAWNKRFLRSIGRDKSDERTHAESEAATEMRVSPDGKHLAFAERFQVFVTPLADASKPIRIGPKQTAMPIHKVSEDAGDYLHWSGDGQSIYWTLGSELHQADVSFAPGHAAASSVVSDLGFEFSTDKPGGVIAFEGARLVTLAGPNSDEVIESGTLIVSENRISAVGAVSDISIPDNALRVDASGTTIIPGLIDAHWHGSQGTQEIQPETNWQNLASLTYGVTTAHDPSNDTSTFFAASELKRAGTILGPRLFSTGTILYGAAGDIRAEVETEADAIRHLRRLKAAGAFSVKSYNQPRRDQRQKIVKAARDMEMLVVNEGGALFQHNMSMIVDGHTGIEHSLSVGAIYDDVVQLWSQTEVGNTPTLGVAYGGIFGERYWYQHTNVWEDERLSTFVPRNIIDAASRRRMMAPEEEYNHILISQLVKKLHDAGVSIQLGAHGQREGLAAHWELWMLEQGGMTPLEAIRVGTLQGARYLGLDEHLGSLEAGKLADLVVLNENPLENLRTSTNVRYVMANGRLYEAATLNEIGNHPRQRGKLWFENEAR